MTKLKLDKEVGGVDFTFFGIRIPTAHSQTLDKALNEQSQSSHRALTEHPTGDSHSDNVP